MKIPKHYWKASHKAWYANIGPLSKGGHPKPVRLVAGPKDEETEKLACLELCKKIGESGLPDRDEPVIETDPLVSALFKDFLDHHKENSALGTHEFYRRPIEAFLRYASPKLRLSTIKAKHVNDWLKEKYPNASDGYRHNIIRSIKAPFLWAYSEEITERVPLRKLKKPKQRARDIDVTPEQWEKIVAKVKDEEFLDVLWTLRLTGCRPQELRAVEKRHVQGDCWVFPVDESKTGHQTGDKRTVMLEGKALEITQRRALRYPDGPLFRNEDGNAWTRRTLARRFERLKLGFPVTAGTLRHSFATDKIVEGVDLVTIATLMGHQDLKMLQKHYQNVKNRPEHLRKTLRKLG